MKFRRNSREIPPSTFNLIGGLGNQLFIYFAALYYSDVTRSEVRLNLSTIGSGGTNHGRLISEFALPGDFQEIQTTKQFGLRSRFARRLAVQFGSFYGFIFGSSNKYYAPTDGFDINLKDVPKGHEINGYFQSWRFVDSINPEKRPILQLTEPSKWYLDMLQRIRAENPLVIHIRSGDYLQLSKTFGVLDQGFYLRAINQIEMSKGFPVWVFSDDLEHAQKLLSDPIFADAFFVRPPSDSSASESLLLMSMASKIVIANSSFSWWAAKIGQESKEVFVPSPWFRNYPIPNELIPNSWREIQSSWI